MYVCACVHMCVLVSTFYWSEWHIKTLLPFIFHSILFIYTFPPPTFRTHQTASFSTIKNTLEHSRREGWHIICSVSQSCPTLCNSMDCSTPGFPVLPHLLELAQTHIHWHLLFILTFQGPFMFISGVFGELPLSILMGLITHSLSFPSSRNALSYP